MATTVDARRIIAEGDVTALVESAQQIGNDIARQLSTSQIRNVFGEVRRIQMNWPEHQESLSENDRQRAQDAYRQTVLLRPKLAYQARKERGRGVEELQAVLDPCIEIIQKADSAKKKLYFDRFVDFFEAILAYHKAAGGRS